MSSPVLNRQAHQIGFGELRAGHLLHSRILLQDGTFVAAANQVVSTTLLERLNNYAKLGVIKEPITVE
jgi:hypothetical protein